MAGDIKVLLLEHVDALGSAGDIVTVSEGYARNKLFPEGKAALATSGEQQKHKDQEKRAAKKAEVELAEYEAQAEKLDGTELQLIVKVNQDDELFGSITPKLIVAELEKQAGLTVSPRDISITKPIKQLGTYDMTVTLSDVVEFSMVVSVVPDDKD